MSINTYQGHHARKRFGQNFLVDESIIENIISAINPQHDDAIIEIGPGLGALTRPLIQHLTQLFVIEIDRDLVSKLLLDKQFIDKITIYQQDALFFNFEQVYQVTNKPLRIIGNLPYNISTPLLFHLFNFVTLIQDMYFMLQKEVVERLVAGPNNKNYGRLSVMAQYYCQIIPILEVPPHSFKPAPKIDSAVVKMSPHTHSPYQVKSIDLLNKVTSSAFGQRRKTIKNSLSQLFTSDQLIEAGFDLTLRAENINVHQYCQLANLLPTTLS